MSRSSRIEYDMMVVAGKWSEAWAEEKAKLVAEIDRCHARLEIDHEFVMLGDDLERCDIPFEDRADQIDGIEARDATISILENQVAALSRREAALREALEPFAREADQWEGFDDAEGLVEGWNSGPSSFITVGTLRRARTLLNKEGEK